AQDSPRAAQNGAGFLVAWTDHRNSASLDMDIFGTRVGSAGQAFDDGGTAMARQTGTQTAPAISSDGTNYCVVWADTRNATSSGSDIFGGLSQGLGPSEKEKEVTLSTVLP